MVYDAQRTITITSIRCGECGLYFGIDSGYMEQLKETHATFYCPKGHSRYFPGKSDEERLQERLMEAEDRAMRYMAEVEFEKNKARAWRAANTRAKNKLKKTEERIKNGVCPCCNRTFQNLQRHMQNQHPEYSNE